MFYERDILHTLLDEINRKEIVVITGMRQVGKTTILEHIFNELGSNNKAILDAGNPLHRNAFDEINYDKVMLNLREYGLTSNDDAYVFIDEIQNMPEISKVIKYLYDHFQVKFFVTGSSSYYLKNLFPESLAGRKFVYELFPLTFKEFLAFKEVDRKDQITETLRDKEKARNKLTPELYNGYFEEYMKYGGFPGVVIEKDNKRKEGILDNIFKSYFEIDVKNLADFKDLSKLRDLILLLVARVGYKLDISKLASELEISRETVYSYLSFLERTYFISMVPKYSKSLDRSSAGNRKLYYCDSGLANYLGNISGGQLFENTIYQNLKPKYRNISYFSKRTGAEIDFILGGNIAIEVKLSAEKRHLVNTNRISRELGLQESYVVSKKFFDNEGIILAQDL
ncbi:hypothetical protein A2982_02080 [candidate division WWE3 bacterium RIFCSPLOWO2_01_FULL_39_13]|uniref:ATPase n=1 Tax=candidate division WWE3 bacterium RIFCSPLOWO2_01_FULL_39_13 TaxID=1802624 RepID=A0A1F4V361_UNCKA|nr:MAG: hypothetical protein A2982_02080 [candidate division WWE3 bacterium RIFCSPLOWO2_01_FULL_39_13]